MMSLMIGRVAEIVISHQWRMLATSAPLRSLHKFHMLVYVCWIVYEYIYYFKILKSVFEITHKSVNKWLKLNFEKKKKKKWSVTKN